MEYTMEGYTIEFLGHPKRNKIMESFNSTYEI